MNQFMILTALALSMPALIPEAAEYNYNCIGKYTDSFGGNFKTAPFDGNDKTYLAWTDEQGNTPCGLVVNFYKSLNITDVKILTDGTVEKMTAEVERWDAEKFRWTPFVSAAGWKKSQEQGKNLFTLENENGYKSCGIRIVLGKSRFRIYECAVSGYGENGKRELFTAPFTSGGSEKRVIIVPDQIRDLVSGNRRMTLWQPGGISQKSLVVGLCNGTERNDRVLMRLDFSSMIEKGHVTSAELSFVAEPFGDKLSRSYLLEYLPNDNPELTKTDLSQDRTVTIACFVSDDMKYPQEFKVDLSGFINTALTRGAGVCKFRFRDMNADQYGNPQKSTSGISLSAIKLVVIP